MTIFMVLFSLTGWQVAGQCSFTATASQGCSGGTGSIQLSLTGVAPWQITWTGTTPGSQNTSSSLHVLAGLVNGNYSLTVTDATGCTSTGAATVLQPPLGLDLTTTSLPSCSSPAGSINLTVNGGIPPYTYVWSNGAVVEDPTSLTIGVYTVTVTDANGCTAVKQTTVGSAININGVVTYQSCTANANGNINVSVSGGQAPYTYLWSNAETIDDLSNVAPGNYTVTVTDMLGCTASATYTLSQNPVPVITITGNSVICAGTSTTITASAPGALDYSWSDGATGAVRTINNLAVPGGTFTVTVTNTSGCTATKTHHITVNPLPVINISGSSSICAGASTTLTATGDGTFLWSTTAISTSIEVSTPGVYTVTVTSPNGCTATASTTVVLSPMPVINITGNQVICVGSSSVLTATEGVNYIWSNGSNISNITVSTAGTYTVTVTNSSGCVATASVTVIINQTPTASISGVLSICAGQTTTLTAAGGDSYDWNTTATTPSITVFTPGTYTVTVTNIAGCTATKQVTVGPVIATTLDASAVSCAPDALVNIDITATGGQMPYTYSWNTGQITEDLSNMPQGEYTVTITDLNGCSNSATSNIAGNPSVPVVTLSKNANINCVVPTVTLTALPATNASYIWSSGATPVNGTNKATVTAAGTYTVTVTNTQSGCTGTAVITVTSNGNIPNISSQVTPPTCSGCNGVINITASGGLSPYTYDWADLPGTNNPEDKTNLCGGTYTLTVTDANGCTISTSTVVSQPTAIIISVVPGGITKPTCFGASNGAIDLTVTSGQAPYTYLWSTGDITEDITGIPAGNYTLTVTDIAGCTKTQTLTVTQPSLLISNPSSFPVTCQGMNDGSIHISVAGGTSPYSYIWSDGSIMGNRNNLEPGVYAVTITDSKGCTSTQSVEVSGVSAISSQPLTTQSCGSTTVNASATTGGTVPYTYLWSNAITGPINVLSASGNYSLTITDANGCTLVQTFDIAVVPENECAFFAGRVVSDDNNNCFNDAEPGLGGWIVRASNATNTYYGLSNSDGSYYLGIPSNSIYAIEAIPPGSLWTTCPPLFLSAPVTPDTLTGVDLPVQRPLLCPELEVSLASGLVRRCLSNNIYSLSYCNNGTAPAENAYIVLSLDALTTPVSSNLPFTNLGNNNYRFNLGNLSVGQCGYFNVFFNVSCAANLGQTLCSSAHIYPDTTCMPVNALWSGASLQLSSTCNADSLKFNIKNVGFGPMNQALEYIVVEDHVMLLTAPVQLGSGQSTTIAVPSNGSTWYLSIPQVPYHPGYSMPALAVEGCTPNQAFSTGFVNQFPLDEADPWIDVDCKTVTGSYDPNDKTGFPTGYGEEHYIAPGTTLNYLIRFQNTGTDTAFTVRVVDTLSQWLDPATIRAGASSHPYTFDLTGEGIASFLFENIFLPDSNINEAASHGFVQFSILPKIITPLETVLENTAAIYFDLNEPVLTNTTHHRLGDHFITVGLWQPARPQYEVSVVPNPSNGAALISVKGLTNEAPLQLQIVDLYGKVVLDRPSASPQFRLEAIDLPEGMYVFRLIQEGALVGNGKIMVGRK